ncbi:hypothetical protein [Methyloceanibacter sp. wino2]|uniref:hypothetical protein n=1 Tax=Methyloceanibacter sp. wino2 TaxID=2170729 RepID=UPI000D3E0394|nr:hypothetical protein [Methyloceanibacter sp. wino2]
MAYARIALGIVGLLLSVGTLAPASTADVSKFTPMPTSMVVPVKAAKAAPVCQRIVRCAGCRPVYRCQVCRKRPICTHGVCIYRTVCGWGPALPSLPKGARVVRVR